MKLHASPKLAAYLGLAGVFVLAAVALGRVELAALGLPFLLALVAGLLLAHPPKLRLEPTLSEPRVLEGDQLLLRIGIRSAEAVPWLEVAADIPPALRSGAVQALKVRLPRGGDHQLEIPLTARRWGVYDVGRLFVRTRDALDLFSYEESAALDTQLRVYPQPAAVRKLLAPRDTQLFVGNQLSRARGDGIEFAEVRPFSHGDRVRRINWPLSTRLGRLHVNQQHPERNNDIVLFLDTYSDLPGLDEA